MQRSKWKIKIQNVKIKNMNEELKKRIEEIETNKLLSSIDLENIINSLIKEGFSEKDIREYIREKINNISLSKSKDFQENNPNKTSFSDAFKIIFIFGFGPLAYFFSSLILLILANIGLIPRASGYNHGEIFFPYDPAPVNYVISFFLIVCLTFSLSIIFFKNKHIYFKLIITLISSILPLLILNSILNSLGVWHF